MREVFIIITCSDGIYKYVIYHLKGSECQVEEYLIILCDGSAERNEDNVVDPKQRDQQQGGFSQSPERK